MFASIDQEKPYFIYETHVQLHIPGYMMKFDIYFTIYTINILDKVPKKLYILIKRFFTLVLVLILSQASFHP